MSDSTAKSTHMTVRLPADVAQAVQDYAEYHRIKRSQAMAALIRQGFALDPDRLLAEIAAARNAAETAAARAEQATSAAQTASGHAESAHRQTQATARVVAHHDKHPPIYEGQAAGWFGRMTVKIRPQKRK